MDELLPGQVFVDRYRVVHEALLVSRESYSIQDREPLYLPERRQAEVKTSVGSIVAYDPVEVNGRGRAPGGHP